MKISIITIHNIHNFGSVFQAYALCKYLCDCGYDAEIVDYSPEYFRNKSLRTLIGQYLNYKAYMIRTKKYNNFIFENLKLSSKKFFSYEELKKDPPKADIYIAGGDQLWNSYHDCGKDNAYKLLFVKGTKISYGTSMGRKNFTQEELLILKDQLAEFSKISVREFSSIPILKSIGINTAVQAVDPVLLLGKKDYLSFISKPPIEKYVFVYLVQSSILLDKTIEFISKKLGFKVVLYAGFSKKCKCDFFFKDLGPDEVLSYIKHASFVISASFHANLFSIMFHKQFVSLLPDKNTNERIEDLLGWTKLKNRIIRGESGLISSLFEPIDYINVDLVIEKMVHKSKEYLTSSLAFQLEGDCSEN